MGFIKTVSTIHWIPTMCQTFYEVICTNHSLLQLSPRRCVRGVMVTSTAPDEETNAHNARAHPRSHKEVICRAGVQVRIKELHWAVLLPVRENYPELKHEARGREHVPWVWLPALQDCFSRACSHSPGYSSLIIAQALCVRCSLVDFGPVERTVSKIMASVPSNSWMVLYPAQ